MTVYGLTAFLPSLNKRLTHSRNPDVVRLPELSYPMWYSVGDRYEEEYVTSLH